MVTVTVTHIITHNCGVQNSVLECTIIMSNVKVDGLQWQNNTLGSTSVSQEIKEKVMTAVSLNSPKHDS